MAADLKWKTQPMSDPRCSKETYAFIRQCDTCGVTTAIDLDPTPEHWRELQLYGQTIRKVPIDQAKISWKTASSCKCKPL